MEEVVPPHKIFMDGVFPSQKIFILNIIEVNRHKVVISTMDGVEVQLPLVWRGHTFPILPQDHREQGFHEGTLMTMKQLGIVVRRALGLPGVTPLGVSVRILYGDTTLGVHQPLATIMDKQSQEFQRANVRCHFCHLELSVPSWPSECLPGPFASCYFCEDKPSWHHGWCCPHNPDSHRYRGRSHTTRYRASMTATHTRELVMRGLM